MKCVHLLLIKICWSVPCKAWSFSCLSSKLQQFTEHEIHCLYGLRQCFLKTLFPTTPRKINSPFLSRSPMRSINKGWGNGSAVKALVMQAWWCVAPTVKLLRTLACTCNPSVGCEDSGEVWGLLASYFSNHIAPAARTLHEMLVLGPLSPFHSAWDPACGMGCPQLGWVFLGQCI